NSTVVIESPQGVYRTWTATATVASGSFYQTTLTRAGPDDYSSGKQPPYFLAQSGSFMTGPAGPTNTVATLAGTFHSLVAGDSQNLASTIPYSGTNGALVWLKTGTNNWGEYFISTYGQQGALPPGLTLYPDGTISGSPTSAGTNNGVFNFTVAAEDTSSNIAVQPLSITVTGTEATTLGSATLMTSSNTFQMQINGVQTGFNYTVQMSTNLASTNWTAIFTTNAPGTNALLIPDANATNQSRFYRVLVAP
ncbi:MAG TPA: putative Ig domain-containing protein, partial [Verrucomicrobiae bacterium]|nr:putative Ig domain-containing protein [Verrucomicrobiae bacterium]